jgi:hypothetical protein
MTTETTGQLKRAAGPVTVGDSFILTHAAYHLLDGTQGQTKDPAEMSAILLDAYQNPRENEAPTKEGYIRFGYLEVRLFMQFPGVLGETVVLSWKAYEHRGWREMGGPEITGDYGFIYPETKYNCPASFYCFGTTGHKLSKLFAQIAPEPSFIFIMDKLVQPGPCATDRCAMLFLQSTDKGMAEGKIYYFAHIGIVDTWNYLWRLEHPEDEYRP